MFREGVYTRTKNQDRARIGQAREPVTDLTMLSLVVTVSAKIVFWQTC